ncbi:hypothetical protein JNW90_09010 [Micromonospora sp. STR1s_5]|nr:hypothetical protein [Micromonospora sp. STR1s_5]
MTDAMNDHERELANRFKRDTANHAMTVLHDDGLYRHLRLADPKSSFYWFEIITWPGSLTVRGDCGGFMFSRISDMFEFFRSNGNTHRINPGYWAEKMPDGGRSVHVYSEDKLRAKVTDALDDYETNHPELVHLYLNAKAKYEATPHAARWPSAYKGPKEPVEPKTPAEVREIVTDHDEDGLLTFEDARASCWVS